MEVLEDAGMCRIIFIQSLQPRKCPEKKGESTLLSGRGLDASNLYTAHNLFTKIYRQIEVFRHLAKRSYVEINNLKINTF